MKIYHLKKVYQTSSYEFINYKYVKPKVGDQIFAYRLVDGEVAKLDDHYVVTGLGEYDRLYYSSTISIDSSWTYASSIAAGSSDTIQYGLYFLCLRDSSNGRVSRRRSRARAKKGVDAVGC